MAALRSLAALQAEVNQFTARLRMETGVPGIGIAISVAGRRIESHAGTRRADGTTPLMRSARWHLGCATKLLLAAAALELARSRRLVLGAPLGFYLPELAGCVHGETIELAHLLSHTSGYRGVQVLDARAQALDWPGFVRYLRAAPQHFAPGSVFSYEHTESVLLGEILRRAVGEPIMPWLARTLLAPLGIAPAEIAELGDTDAGRHEQNRGTARFVPLTEPVVASEFWRPAFSSYAVTLGELVTLAEALAGIARAGREPPLAAETAALLVRRVVTLPATTGGPLRELLPIGFGLGAAELRGGFHGSAGLTAGQCVGLRYDPSSRIAVAVGVNALLPYLRDFVLTTVCRDLTGRTAAHEPRRFELELADLAGVYHGPGDATVVVRFAGGRLHCALGRAGSSERVDVDFALDDDGRPVLRSTVPHLSLGFFREPRRGDVGLMLGLYAYRRVAASV